MNKETKNKVVPKLRFPEFMESGEWREKKLGDIGEPLMCKRIFKGQTTTNAMNGVPFYKIGTFGKVADSFISCKLFEEFRGKYSFPKIGDILISAAGTIGRLVIYNGSPSYFQDSNIVWLGNNEELVINSFLFHSCTKMKCRTSDGGIISRLYNSDLKNMNILFPKEKEEQQKIADCLSSLDELITAQNQKLEALKAHKKGMMQQLFPAEGETVPILRFVEFKRSGEWVEKKINELIPMNKKYGIVDGPFGSNLKTIHYKTEGIPIIRSGYVTDGKFDADKYLYVSEQKFKEEKRSAVRGGDIVMAKIGARCGASAILPANHQTSILSGNALKITVDETRFSTQFIWQRLWQLHSSHKLTVLIKTGAQPAISMANLKEFVLLVPSMKIEQEKIASCLFCIKKD
jgi:restriction endonuclease S subunit